MEIVTIEKKTFELWQEKFNHFINRMDALCIPLRRKQDKWLDNCETCRLLNVSARTMQTYRDTGKYLIRKSITRFIIRFRMWKPLCKITWRITLKNRTYGFDNERFQYNTSLVFIPWPDVGECGIHGNELSSGTGWRTLPDRWGSLSKAVYQQANFAGLQRYRTVGICTASRKDNL